LVRLQGITQNHHFAGSRRTEALEEIVDLRRIDREERKTGVETFATLLLSIVDHPLEPGIGPVAVGRELFDDWRNIRGP